MPNTDHRHLNLLRLLGGIAVLLGLAGCGGSSDETASEAFPPQDITAERDAFYASYKYVPLELKNQLADNKITQEEYDEKVAAMPLFFEDKTIEDLPADLDWEDGSDLPEFANVDAPKGGTFYNYIQDFPRTLRLIGPDANGSFRPFLLDYMDTTFAKRHPNDTSLGKYGFKYFPLIASAWAADPDTQTVYVKINPNARWSDGEPVTSEDEKFAFFFFQTSYIQAPWYVNFYSSGYTKFTKYDDHTFSLRVAERRPDYVGRVVELNPVPAHFYKELGPDFPQRYQWRFVPTPGPYVVKPEDIDKGRAITLTRLKDWWAKDKKFSRGRFNPDRIRFTVVRDSAKAFEMFRNGELDHFGMNTAEFWYDKMPNSAPEVQNGYIHKITFYNDVPRPTYALWINEAMPLLSDREVRLGIQYASNWALVIQKFARGDWARMNTTSDGYGDMTDPDIKARPFDIAKAREHFAKAGFTTPDSDGILKNAEGQRLSFTLSTGYERLRDVLSILREEARKCGLEFRLEVLDGTAAWKKVQEKKHDIALTAFGVTPEMYPRYWENWHSSNAYDRAFLPDGSVNPDRKIKTQTNNITSTAIPELDKLIDTYDRSNDIDAMRKMAFRMEEIIYDNAAFVPGFVIPSLRDGYWRWIKHPDDYNVKISTIWDEYFLYWIDQDMKKETLDARRSGKTFEPYIHTYDQYKLEP